MMGAEIKVVLRQISPSTSEATMGKHKVLVDRPAAKGGSDLGAMGGELFLSSVGGCFMSNLFAAMRARNAELSNVTAEVTGTIADSPPRFASLDINVIGEGNQELLQHLVGVADRGCIMMNTLREKLAITLRVGSERAVGGKC
jgi:putative redox protein